MIACDKDNNDKAKMNRRDFLKCIPLFGALVVAPKALVELELPLEVLAQRALPMELETALYNRTTLRLDSLGIRLDGLDEFQDNNEWRAEVLRRWEAML